MFDFFPKPPFQSTRTDPVKARYAELQDVDRALRDAESKLKTAHLAFARHEGPPPDALYRDVVRLRQQARNLLSSVGDLFFAEQAGVARPLSGKRSPE